jgi:hypothetical protein
MVQFFNGFESAIYTPLPELPSLDVQKSFGLKKWLNKKLKPDKEFRNRDDFVFLSEIINNYIC